MKRRTYLATASTTAAIAIAGCAGGIGTTDDTDDPDDPNESDGNETDGDGDDPNGDDELPEMVGTFDDFEDLSAWEAVAGSLEADSERTSMGSQSAHISMAESETQARIVRELSEPIDVEGVVPGLALSTDSSTNVVIQLQDAGGDFHQFIQYTYDGQPFVRQNFGHTEVTGDVDLNEITEIHITFSGGDDNESHLWVDDLHFVPRVEDGRVMVQFQGGFESDYTHAFPIMEEYDLTGATFVATDRIRITDEASGDRMTEDQLAELVDAGWSLGTVGSRGLQLHRVDSDQAESDILDPLAWFEDKGYDDVQYFAFPGGRYDPEMYELVGENYDLGFAGRYMSQGWASNRLNITRISADAGQRNLNADQLVDILDWTAEHGGITTIVFYKMDQEDASALETMASRLAEHRSAGDLELITPGEIANEYVP